MYGSTSSAYGLGYAIGTLIGLAAVIAVIYVLPMFLAATVFQLKKKQAVGVITLAYAIVCSLFAIIGMVANYGALAPFLFIAIFNIIATVVLWATQNKGEKNDKSDKR